MLLRECDKMKNTFKVALGGIIAALSIVIMLLSGLIPIGTYALPALSGILLIAIVIEAGFVWAFGVFAVVSVLSLFLVADKEAVLCFIAFLGYYPILKSRIELISKRSIQIIVKLLVFNTAAVTAYFVAVNVLAIPVEEFYIGEYNLPAVLLAVGNILMLLYDYAISLLVTTYVQRLRGKLNINKFR